jgi:hypothetical protein
MHTPPLITADNIKMVVTMVGCDMEVSAFGRASCPVAARTSSAAHLPAKLLAPWPRLVPSFRPRPGRASSASPVLLPGGSSPLALRLTLNSAGLAATYFLLEAYTVARC